MKVVPLNLAKCLLRIADLDLILESQKYDIGLGRCYWWLHKLSYKEVRYDTTPIILWKNHEMRCTLVSNSSINLQPNWDFSAVKKISGKHWVLMKWSRKSYLNANARILPIKQRQRLFSSSVTIKRRILWEGRTRQG